MAGYLRRRWGASPEDADDICQDFFERLVRTNPLGSVSAGGARFRSYLRRALDNGYALLHRRRRARRKCVPLRSEPTDDCDPATLFQREWARSLLQAALDDLRAQNLADGKEHLFELLLLHDVERPRGVDFSHAALARRFAMTTGQVNNSLYRSRLQLRAIVTDRLRGLGSSEADVKSELPAARGGGALHGRAPLCRSHATRTGASAQPVRSWCSVDAAAKGNFPGPAPRLPAAPARSRTDRCGVCNCTHSPD